MYKIGEISRYCGLPVKTLRYWADIGLLVPDETDHFTGYRYYSSEKLAECIRIVTLKELGFCLEEIRQYRDGSSEELIRLIERRRNELAAIIEDSGSKLKRLTEMLGMINSGGGNMLDIVVKKQEGFRAVLKRRVFETRAEALRELEAVRDSIPEKSLGARRIIINYETEFNESGFDLAVGVEVKSYPERKLDGAEVKTVSFNNETAFAVLPKTGLEAAYREFSERLGVLSLQVIGSYYELYHEKGDIVELCVPVCRLHEEQPVVSDIKPDLFDDCPQVIGIWEFADLVPSEEQFNPARPKYSDRDNIWLKRLCFLEGGAGFWIVDGWSKGKLYTSFGYPRHSFTSDWRIAQIHGETYMFIKMKDYYYESRGGFPLIYIYKQADRISYTKDGLRIRDELPQGFDPDESVLGEWKARDFVHNIADFDENKQNFPESELFWSSVKFNSDGSASVVRGGHESMARYTRGLLIEDFREITESYEIHSYGGREYLFCQWKSGDYVFGGRRIQWYVFMK